MRAEYVSAQRSSLDGLILSPPTTVRAKWLYPVLKRALDLALALLLLPILLPLCCVIAALIYLSSPGPILFMQKRTGKDGRRFDMFKFRTMVPDAETLKPRLAHLNELSWPDFKIARDPRVTPIGRFLRKTSLDELPQVLNILAGDMSWVGPRPTSFGPETYKLWHLERLQAVPGLTGLWQVSGRSHVDFDERVRLDIEYIQRQSLWFDIWILIRTIKAVVDREGAY